MERRDKVRGRRAHGLKEAVYGRGTDAVKPAVISGRRVVIENIGGAFGTKEGEDQDYLYWLSRRGTVKAVPESCSA